MTPSAADCAHELLEVIPEAMQTIRSEIRRQRDRDLSILQFRTLAYLGRHPGATLSAVADHVGLTLSSMSTQITKLVHRRLVERLESTTDRRFVTLSLTDAGQTMLDLARQGAQESLAVRCAKLSAEERALLIQALQIVRIFSAATPVSQPEP
jgi:DNA-binding MarR family transcriptional regulator